jgi:hypothetical protein
MGNFLRYAFMISAGGFFLWLVVYFAWLAIKPEKKPGQNKDISVKPSR